MGKMTKNKKQLFGCFCEKCGKKLFRRKAKRNKPTKCNYCGYKILNPYETFTPKTKYLKLKNKNGK